MLDLFFPAAEDHLLAAALDAALPFRIHDLARQGGPQQSDYDRLAGTHHDSWHPPLLPRSFADALAEEADVLQFGGGRRRRRAELFAGLVHALAVMSFCPGGVRFCGRRWDAASGFPYEVCDPQAVPDDANPHQPE